MQDQVIADNYSKLTICTSIQTTGNRGTSGVAGSFSDNLINGHSLDKSIAIALLANQSDFLYFGQPEPLLCYQAMQQQSHSIQSQPIGLQQLWQQASQCGIACNAGSCLAIHSVPSGIVSSNHQLIYSWNPSRRSFSCWNQCCGNNATSMNATLIDFSSMDSSNCASFNYCSCVPSCVHASGVSSSSTCRPWNVYALDGEFFEHAYQAIEDAQNSINQLGSTAIHHRRLRTEDLPFDFCLVEDFYSQAMSSTEYHY